ncbi:hypothetical protein PPACK8108_LOCUS3760 [Phakopsora pachyrhizi]|uniref:Uncharacterized protein n=1 Tax=Phakopsora pachyrhizi TaxID=170000 RepID=A0AAV0APB8_PHAPC|nr:hypothetical protein PPACK8108_LOCUS3760 [Phakopsora pachyrhizi]
MLEIREINFHNSIGQGLVKREFKKEKELTPAEGQKENMTSVQDRYRQDWALDEEALEEIR